MLGGMRLRIVDAFTDKPFAGNPAGVVVLEGDEWPDESVMRQVAAELSLPMTAFVRPLLNGADADWALRWFNPVIEEDLCGHATLATAHALHQDRGEPGIARFATRSGVLVARSRRDGMITLDLPAAEVEPIPFPAGLADALGIVPEKTFSTGSLRDVIVVLTDEAAVRAVTPDMAAVASVSRRDDIRGVTITAAASDSGTGYDFVSRFFSPADGIPEDSVTGSAHTALAPYWASRLGRSRLVGFQASARTGVVGTEVQGDRVHISGRAVTIVDGALLHGPDFADWVVRA
jgi:PhzF family phenazine biosynthesis protein